MKKFYIVLLSLQLLTFVSCNKEIEIDKGIAPSVLYLPESGVINLTSYDVGEQFNQEIWVNKGGLTKNSSSVSLSVDPKVLDSINGELGTSYKLLPEECYQLSDKNLSINDGEVNKSINLIYDPKKILNKSGGVYDVDTYALPIRISSSDAKVNKHKSTMLYTFRVSDPILKIFNGGVENVELNSADKLELVTNIGVPFQNKWKIEANIVHSQQAIDDYNNANNSFFALLPRSVYQGDDKITLEKGETTKSIVYSIEKNNILPGNYILPVQLGAITSSLDGVVTNNIKAETTIKRMFILSKLGEKISKSNWSIASFSTEEDKGENNGRNGRAVHLIDDNNNTFWHSKWKGGKASPPYEVVIDMGSEHLVSQIEIIPRNHSGNGIKYLRFETSSDQVTWEYVGKFDFDKETPSLMYPVKASNCRYIKLLIPGDAVSNKVAAIVELNAYGL